MQRFMKSLVFAFTGIYTAFKSKRNFRIQCIILFLAIAVGLYLGLSELEWGLMVLSSGFVLAAELFNTAIEKLGDGVADNKQSRLVCSVKDISAGAVLLSALTAFVIGILVLFIPFLQRMLELL